MKQPSNSTTYFWIFLILGLVVQCVTYWLMPDTPWSLISGLLGICSVVLSAQGNILTFVFGFGQVATYTYLCVREQFYAEIALNIYYFVTMIYGVYVWKKRLQTDSSLQIQTRQLRGKSLPLLLLSVTAFSVLVGWFLQVYTDDPQPYLDAFTTVPALVAQILMILAYREQWYIWMMVDVLALVMWLRAGNYCMAAQYFFWCANCVYGYVQWTRYAERPLR
ncbi:MAG: nicotinamide mononucleotide transporter [Paludibacteraceae bacterium]|nr:nicotinamide mononucleotide transporter [Paludibacteraceae bacterium]